MAKKMKCKCGKEFYDAECFRAHNDSCNVVELNSDTLFYIKGNGEDFDGVGDSESAIEFFNASGGTVSVYQGKKVSIDRNKFKQLCIAWLALNYPDSLNSQHED